MQPRHVLNAAFALALLASSGHAQIVLGPATNYATPQRPSGVAAADFDGDGDIDLAVTNQRDRSITIFVNTGSGAFVPGNLLSTGSQLRPEGIDADDIDGDGDPDLVVATSGNNLNFVSIFTNMGGSFAGPINLQSGGTDPGAIAAVDLDLDGDSDIVVVNEDSGNIAVLENIGTGAFAPPVTIATGPQPDALVTATLNAGTLLDIAVTNTLANTTSVILSPENVCYADCDQSGTLDIYDFLCFQNSFVLGEPYACDCDPDPPCDIFDFLCFQTAFVAGCP